jgi:hypothetical protein
MLQKLCKRVGVVTLDGLSIREEGGEKTKILKKRKRKKKARRPKGPYPSFDGANQVPNYTYWIFNQVEKQILVTLHQVLTSCKFLVKFCAAVSSEMSKT